MNSILSLIGNTPLVEIKKLNPNPNVKIFAKLEGFNPTGSIKDRIALAMIEDAEKTGRLKKEQTIIEPTSGNTGISVAMVAAMKGYKVIIMMPEHMSVERRKMIKAFGAELILVKPEEWRDAAIKKVKTMVAADGNLVMLNQFENQQNCDIHYRTTGKEIINEIDGEVNYFIAGVGTGGTITGIARSLRESWPNVRVVGIQPIPGEKIEGLKSIKDGYVPPILCPSLPCADHSRSLIDIVIDVDSAGAFATARDLAQKEGLFVGASSGAAMAMAIKYAQKIKKGIIVTVFPDRGEKYLSTEMFGA
ncbi:MAG: cysteine synthase family protein [Minisyncoccales bacterium]